MATRAISTPRRAAAREQSSSRLFKPRPAGRAGPLLTAFSYVVTIVVGIICSLPFFYILSTSLKEQQLLFTYPPIWIPQHLYWGNYTGLLFNTPFVRWVFNTLLVASTVTVVKVIFDSMAGYAFAKMKFPFKNVLFVIVIMTMMIPFSAILIPLYLTVVNLNILNTYLALIVPFAGDLLGVPPPPDLLQPASNSASASEAAPRAKLRLVRMGRFPLSGFEEPIPWMWAPGAMKSGFRQARLQALLLAEKLATSSS